MKQKHLICVMVLLFGMLMAGYASSSRVESMGKNDDYFMDGVSIFRNPANINLYSNFLVGELGQIPTVENMADRDKDPSKQWFGGAASYKIGDGSKVTFGIVFNREDELVTMLKTHNSGKYLIKFADSLVVGDFMHRDANGNWDLKLNETLHKSDNIVYSDKFNWNSETGTARQNDSVEVANAQILEYVGNGTTVQKIGEKEYAKNIPDPVGKTDFFLGYSNGKDLHVGGHFYVASQDSGAVDNTSDRSESHVYKGDIGINYGIGNHSLEVSLGIADVSFSSISPSEIREVKAVFANVESKKALFFNTRFFYDMPKYGAKLVPIFSYSAQKVNVFDEQKIKAGVGFNKEIEKGIFYAGLTGSQSITIDSTEVRDWNKASDYMYTTDTTTESVTLSFGVERNIAWKWFVVRVGGKKVISQQTAAKNYKNSASYTKKYVVNPQSDNTPNDVIGFGVGFNFDNKVRVDGTINEFFPYQNPFGYLGNNGVRVATRVSATYSF